MSRSLEEKLREAFGRFSAHDLAGAERLCGEVLDKEPRNAGALHLLGAVKLMGGNAREAITLIDKALKDNPADAGMLENLGLAHLAAQDYVQAETVFRKAMKLGAAHSSLYMRLGLALGPQRKLAEAEGALRTAAERAPGEPDVHLNLGNVLAELGRTDEALACFQKAVSLRPDYVDGHYNLGTLLRRVGRLEDAVCAFEAALAIAPEHAGARNNLGVACEQLERFDEAIECYRKVLALDPANVHAHCNLGSALRMQGRLDEANAHCLRALEIEPNFVEALMNLANIREQQCRFADARAHYEKALELEPRDPELNFIYGALCLGLGDFERGWAGFRWRPARARALAARVALDEALPGDIAGKTVLLLGEQGIGDELFFLRFAARLKALGARVVCECDRKLKSLVERNDTVDRVISPDGVAPARDLTFLSGDLPSILLEARRSAGHRQLAPHEAGGESEREPLVSGGADGTRDAFFPGPLRLTVLEERAQATREYLARLGPPPYLGLTWRAGTPREIQRRMRQRVLCKEIPSGMLAEAIREVPGTFLVFQRYPRAEELARLRDGTRRNVHDLSAANENLEDMLALLSLVDAYVGVSNTNMHLMAGLGKEARVLIPYPAEWRWMVEGGQSPWFPGFALYRQDVSRDWKPALARLTEDLYRSLSERRVESTFFDSSDRE